MRKEKSLNFLYYVSYLILIIFSFQLSLNFFYSLINLGKLKFLDFLIIFLSIFLYFISKYKEDKLVNFKNIFKNFKLNNPKTLFPEMVRLGSSYGFSLSFFYLISIFLPSSIRYLIDSSFIMKTIGNFLQNQYVDLVLEYFITFFLGVILLIIFIFLYFLIASLLYLIFTPFTSNLKSKSLLFFQRAKETVNYLFFKNKNEQEKMKLDFLDYFIIFLAFILSSIIFFYLFSRFENFFYQKLNLDSRKSLLDNLKYLTEIVKIKNFFYFFTPLPIYVFFKILFDRKIRKKFGLTASHINLQDKNQEI